MTVDEYTPPFQNRRASLSRLRERPTGPCRLNLEESRIPTGMVRSGEGGLVIDASGAALYGCAMSDTDPKQTLADIAKRIDQLVAVVERLSDENRSLRHAQDQLVAERANLLAKNEQARSRVEAMIARLRALETSG